MALDPSFPERVNMLSHDAFRATLAAARGNDATCRAKKRTAEAVAAQPFTSSRPMRTSVSRISLPHPEGVNIVASASTLR